MDVKLRPTGMLRQLYLILHKLQSQPPPPSRTNSSNRAEYVRRASAISAPAACNARLVPARTHARTRVHERAGGTQKRARPKGRRVERKRRGRADGICGQSSLTALKVRIKRRNCVKFRPNGPRTLRRARSRRSAIKIRSKSDKDGKICSLITLEVHPAAWSAAAR